MLFETALIDGIHHELYVAQNFGATLPVSFGSVLILIRISNPSDALCNFSPPTCQSLSNPWPAFLLGHALAMAPHGISFWPAWLSQFLVPPLLLTV